MAAFEKGNQVRVGKPNPNAGRKPKRDEDNLQAILNEAWPRERRVQVIQVMSARACSGDEKAAALLLAYAYGKPKQQVDVTNTQNGDTQQTIRIQYVDTPSADPASESERD